MPKWLLLGKKDGDFKVLKSGKSRSKLFKNIGYFDLAGHRKFLVVQDKYEIENVGRKEAKLRKVI